MIAGTGPVSARSWQSGSMKTTIDLPDDLVRQV
jgi:hypothetical protein